MGGKRVLLDLNHCKLVLGYYSFGLRSGHIYMKDAHSAESNEKSSIIFLRFLVFELWLIAFTI